MVVTNYPTAKDQINHGYDGLICDLNPKAIAQTIYNLSTRPEMFTTLSNYLHEHDFGNERDIEILYQLLCI